LSRHSARPDGSVAAGVGLGSRLLSSCIESPKLAIALAR
jgi:hypothetical protein